MNLFDTTDPIYWVVLQGQVMPGNIYENWMEASLNLVVQDYALGARANIAESSNIGASTGYYMVPDIPGDVDALCSIKIKDTSSGEYINRVRLGRMSKDSMVATDFEPIQNLDTGADGSHGADGGSINSDVKYDTLTAGDTDWYEVGVVTMPDKALHHGLFDIFCRIDDNAAVLGTPSTPTVTIEDGVDGTGNVMEIVQSPDREDTTPTTSETVTWTTATTDGNLLLLHVSAWDSAVFTINTPTGWTLAFNSVYKHATQSYWVGEALFYIEEADSRSGNETITFDQAPDEIHLRLAEISYAGAITVNTFTTDDYAPQYESLSHDASTNDSKSIILLWMAFADADPGWTDWWMGGWNTLDSFSDSEFSNGWYRKTTGAGTYNALTWNDTTTINRPRMAASIAIAQIEDITSPGELKAGTYTFYTVAVDSTGNISAESSGATGVFTADGGKATISCSGGTGDIRYYRVYFQNPDGDYYYVATVDTSTDLVLTTEEGAIQVPDLNWTATATPNLFRVRIGTQNGDAFPAQPVAGKSGGNFGLLYMATGAIPPVPRGYDNTRYRGRVYLDMRNGGGPNATNYCDALWLFPHNEPSVMIEKPVIDQNQRIFHIDTAVDGQVSGSLLNVTTEAIQGQANVMGQMLLAPGDNMLVFGLECYASATDDTQVLTNVQVTIEIDYTPRFDIVAGDY
jgi:hypothetical protein